MGGDVHVRRDPREKNNGGPGDPGKPNDGRGLSCNAIANVEDCYNDTAAGALQKKTFEIISNDLSCSFSVVGPAMHISVLGPAISKPFFLLCSSL